MIESPTTQLTEQLDAARRLWPHVVYSPYRLCPLGAHIDHQGGPALGRTIYAGTVLGFKPIDHPHLRLTSANYSALITFSLEEIPPPQLDDWGNYACGAAFVLKNRFRLGRGLIGHVWGGLPGGGLSSSASVGLSYLAALASANELELDLWELVELGRQIENDYLSVGSGILDQSTILHGSPHSLVYVDTRNRTAELVQDPPEASGWRFLVIYSGFSRQLSATGFSDRVKVCRQAAVALGQAAGLPGARILSDIPLSAFEAHKSSLSKRLQGPTSHFFNESARVHAGRQAWATGDGILFGQLMKESCQSSIHLYGSSSEPIERLQVIVSSAPGVYGSRFSGGGYGGCVVGLLEEAAVNEAVNWIMPRYLAHYPQVSGSAGCFVAGPEGGLRLL